MGIRWHGEGELGGDEVALGGDLDGDEVAPGEGGLGRDEVAS